MHFDIELVLVLATLVCGLVWAADALVFARRRRRANADRGRGDATPGQPTVVEYARSFFPVLLIVLVIRSFLGEPFRIPSQSMLPTLKVGDFIVVNKFAYGLRLPVVHTEFVDFDEPERGDVVVFRYPRDPSVDYIKRVVGLPGDQIAYYNRRLFVNGEPVPMERLGPYRPEEAAASAEPLIEFRERLDGFAHSLLLDPNGQSAEGEFVVPEGRYFVLGDNRDHSNDSRRWGYVPTSHLVGRAEMIWLHWDWSGGDFRWQRIGQFVE